MVRGSRKRSRSRSQSVERKRNRRSRSREKLRRYKRSRSRERGKDDRHRRSRSRSKSRERNRDSDRKSDKKHSKSSHSKSSRKDRSRSKSKEKKKDEFENSVFDAPNLDKEEEQKRLEMEMQKRRERIERWRTERKKKEIEATKKDLKGTIANIQVPQKKWNLEDDSDEEEESKDENKEKSDEEIDPLDAFMQTVESEVKKVNKMEVKKTDGPAEGAGPGLVILTGVAKKKEKDKGELIEQNQDGLEYSSEEEEEDLKVTADGLANKQKKELAKVDHANTNYITFRKNFYIEVPEISKMTQSDVELFKEELEGIKVKGKGCPKPIREWAHCGVSKKALDVLKKSNFEKPTPIQTQAIPAIMSGRDLIGIAKTGREVRTK